MKRAALFIALLAIACGKDSTVTPTPQPTTVALRGNVVEAGVGPVVGATVTILDGANQGRTTSTNTTGEFQLDGLTKANANVRVTAPLYDEAVKGLYIDGTARLDFTLQTPACQTKDFGFLAFENGHPSVTQDVYMDGQRVATITPGQRSAAVQATAGPHLIAFQIANTATEACVTAQFTARRCVTVPLICSGP